MDSVLRDICSRCEVVEECYEFMLGYAAQGLPSERGSSAGGQIRNFLQRALTALSGLPHACALAIENNHLDPTAKFVAFFAVLERDARDSLAAIDLVLAQPAISSQLVDNLNASIHLRALLTDLFLLSEILKKQDELARPAVPGKSE